MQVEMLQRPGSLLEGQLHRCCISMRNSGASALHNVRMIVSHPDVYCPTSDADLHTDVATALSGDPSNPKYAIPPQLTNEQKGRSDCYLHDYQCSCQQQALPVGP